MVKTLVMVVLILFTRTCLSESFGTEKQSSSSPVWQALQSVFTSLCEDGYGFLVSLFGKQHVDTWLRTVMEVTALTSEALADALNVVAAYGTAMLQRAGFNASLPVKHITPEGVIFVTKWTLLALLGYWILSLAVHLVAGIVRRTLWLLKITFGLAMFGLILSDAGASAETTALRLAGLVFACIVLGVGPSPFRGDTTSHLEGKVKVLERRLRDLEKKSKEE